MTILFLFGSKGDRFMGVLEDLVAKVDANTAAVTALTAAVLGTDKTVVETATLTALDEQITTNTAAVQAAVDALEA